MHILSIIRGREIKLSKTRYEYYDEVDLMTITYFINPSAIYVPNAHLIKCDLAKKRFAEHLIMTIHRLGDHRTVKDIVIELKAHNIFYQRGWKIKSTKDADIEFKMKLWHKVAFYIITLLFKER